MTDAMDAMAGVTEERITLPVSAGQYQQLSMDQVMPGRPRVTHVVSVGPFVLPGTWAVVGAHSRIEPPVSTYTVTLARLES